MFSFRKDNLLNPFINKENYLTGNLYQLIDYKIIPKLWSVTYGLIVQNSLSSHEKHVYLNLSKTSSVQSNVFHYSCFRFYVIDKNILSAFQINIAREHRFIYYCLID